MEAKTPGKRNWPASAGARMGIAEAVSPPATSYLVLTPSEVAAPHKAAAALGMGRFVDRQALGSWGE